MSDAKEPIRLGNLVKDLVTKFIGYTVLKAELLSGTIQWGIQPEVEAGSKEIPKAMFIDEFMLEVLEQGFADNLPAIDNRVTIKLGEKVKDKVTGATGIATEKVTFQNGCVQFAIITGLNKDGEQSVLQIDHKRLERVGDGLSKEQKKTQDDAPPKARTGGPMRAIPQRTVQR